jgi:DinB superfamily
MYRFITHLHEVSEESHEQESAASLKRATDRQANPLAAPERAHPKGRFSSLEAALQQFLENRARTIEFVRNCQDDLRCRLIQHPVGVLNGQDCLLLLSHHSARHIGQINELKAEPAFPQSERD